jgi:hypothetical protein
MNTNINKSINQDELISAIKYCYPNALIVVDKFLINIDINDKVKYTIWLKKLNVFEVIPQKAIWNRTFEMKATAQEIAMRLKDFIENGDSAGSSSSETPSVCPSCRNPNTKKIHVCEWCGYQII